MVRVTPPALKNMYSYWKRYIERQMIIGKKHVGPFRGGMKYIKRRNWYYSENRPWTTENQMENLSGPKPPTVYVEPVEEQKIFLGDMVVVMAGKDKGRIGRVSGLIKERNICYVQGLNCKHELIRQDPAPPQMKLREQPLLVTEHVKLYDQSCSEATDVEWRVDDKGEYRRISLKTLREIPISKEGYVTEDLKQIRKYTDNDKDTSPAIASKVTFQLNDMTFEQDIMQQMGIEETRLRGRRYWW